MSRPILVLATVGILLLAGCSGTGGTATEPTVTASTTDPQSTTTPASTPTPAVEFAPGTSADGVDNTSALVQAHLAALDGTAYRVNATQTSAQAETEIVVAEAGDRLRLRTSATGTTDTEVWETATRSITRRGSGERARYAVAGTGTPMAGFTGNLTDLYVTIPLTAIQYGEFTYEGTTRRDGTRLLQFAATDVNETAVAEGNVSNVTDYRATLLVSEQGVIHEATIDAEQTIDGESQSSRSTYTTTLGVEPSPPAWLSEIPALSVSLTGNGSVVAVEHTGGAAVENATVALGVLGSPATIEGRFEAGETRYLGVDSESGEVVVAAERPDPAGLDPIAPSTTFRLSTESVQVSLLVGTESS